MSARRPKPLAETRNRVAFGVLLSAAGLLLTSFLDSEWQSFFAYTARLIRDPERWFDPLSAIAVGCVITIMVITLASPILFSWLHVSRALRIILRFLSISASLILLYLGLTLDGLQDLMLILLIISPFVTFIGLCLIKPFTPRTATP